MGHSSFPFFPPSLSLSIRGSCTGGAARGVDGIGHMKSGVAVPSAACLWSIFPVTLHVAACLFCFTCHVVVLYVHLMFIPHHVLLE